MNQDEPGSPAAFARPTILILDNGRYYSDHRIYFVDCDGMDPDELVRLFVLGRSVSDYAPHEIARAESFEWRTGSSAKPEDVVESPYELPEGFDLSWVSDRGLLMLASDTCGDDDVRDAVAAEQLKREALR